MANPLVTQVKSESQLRYGQPLSDILGARHTAYHQYQNDVGAAEQTAAAVKQAAKQAVGQLRQVYDQADQTRRIASQQIQQAISIAEAPHSALAIALKGESGLATQQMGRERAASQGEAIARGTDATAGLAYAKRNALATYRSTRSDLSQQTRDVHSQMGAFAQSRLADLQSQQQAAQYKASQDAQQQSNSDRSYNLQVAKARGLDPVTGKPLKPKSTGLNPAGIKPLTTTQNDTVLNGIQEAQSWVKNLSSSNHMTRNDIAGHLTRGDTLIDANNNKLKLPKLPKPFIAAAFDLNTQGYLSAPTAKALVTRGVKIPTSWLPPKSLRGAANVLSGTGQRVGNSLNQIIQKLPGG